MRSVTLAAYLILSVSCSEAQSGTLAGEGGSGGGGQPTDLHTVVDEYIAERLPDAPSCGTFDCFSAGSIEGPVWACLNQALADCSASTVTIETVIAGDSGCGTGEVHAWLLVMPSGNSCGVELVSDKPVGCECRSATVGSTSFASGTAALDALSGGGNEATLHGRICSGSLELPGSQVESTLLATVPDGCE